MADIYINGMRHNFPVVSGLRSTQTYFGCDLKRTGKRGFSLQWQSYVNERFIYADTKAGLKVLIKYEVKKGQAHD